MAMIVKETIGCLRPFQEDIGPMKPVKSEETAIQPLAFLLQYTDGHLDTRLTDALNTTPLHLGKRVDTANDNPTDTFTDDQVATGRRLTVVGARLQADVDSGLTKSRLVVLADRRKSIDLGMSLTTTHMIALADDTPIVVSLRHHNHRPHHRVRTGIAAAVLRQLNTAAHVFFVCFSLTLLHFFVLLRCEPASMPSQP